MHDFSKPPHVTSQDEIAKKRRLPVYMLIIVGLFLLAFLVYMIADHRQAVNAEAGMQHNEMSQVTAHSADSKY